MRRIAYVVTAYPATSHTFIRREALALRALGLEITTFSIRRTEPNDIVSDADRREAETTRNVLPMSVWRLLFVHVWAVLRRPHRYALALVEALATRTTGLRALVYRLFYFAEAMQLAKLLHDARIEHVHNHFANSGADVSKLAASYLGLPWSLTLHGTVDFEYPASQTLRAKIERAAFVACVSDFGRAQAMRAASRACWNKVQLVRCGLDPAELAVGKSAQSPLEPPAARRRTRLLYIGRLSEEKGLSVLLGALDHLTSTGADVELCLVGDGPERKAVEAEIAARQLQGRCQLMGAVAAERLAPLYARCDMFVMSSFMEGLPIVLMEAMAHRKPVVAPSVGGIPELVLNGETGLLFNPADSISLARQVRRLIDDPALCSRLGEHGRRKVEEQHAIERCVLPLFTLFTGMPPPAESPAGHTQLQDAASAQPLQHQPP